jgi:hypothetical protein
MLTMKNLRTCLEELPPSNTLVFVLDESIFFSVPPFLYYAYQRFSKVLTFQVSFSVTLQWRNFC